jgi:alanine racemase
VRPGIALYGYSAAPTAALPDLEPALEWTTRVVAVHAVPKGRAVSYGGTFRACRPSRIATLPLGYADGYPRAVSNGAEVIVGGRRAPVVGNVCMDMFMVDVTDVPGADVGEEVVLVGGRPAASGGRIQITATDLANWAGTLHYEILTGISKRVPRVYTP